VAEALEVFEQGVQFFPQSPVAHFNLARAALSDNRAADAKNSLMKALSLNPDYSEAMALMANLQLQSGEYSSAEININKLLARSPNDLSLKLQFAAIKRGQGSPEEAIEIYNELEAAHPENAQLPLLRAQLYAQQNNSAEAKKAIEKALKRDPDQLLALDLWTSFLISEERFNYALEQVSQRIERNPDVSGYYLIKAKVHVANEDLDQAEKLLLKAIDLDPDNRTPYMILSQVYVRDEKRAAALERLQQVVSKNPEDISALMIMCGIYEYEKQFENARYTYEKILTANPNFPPALNNLGYLFSEVFNLHDEAYEYTNRARQLLPHDPAIADTLGWILYKRGDIEWARSLIQESAEKLSDNAEVRYHLGMTYYMLGDEDVAKEHLLKALSLSEDFNGKGDVEKRLSILEIGSSEEKTLPVSELEKRAKSSENDPVLLTRLAQVYENSGEVDNALETYEKVLSLNSNNVPAIVKTASLQLQKGNSKAAFELAKGAYRIEPNSPEVSAQLGKLAFVEGDYEWSTSLLQTSARNKPGDPDILFDLSLSLISIGKDEEAKEQLASIPASERTGSASQLIRFLDAVESKNSSEMLNHANALKVNLISRWSEAVIAKIEQDNEKALNLYHSLLANFPTFDIAKRELTFLFAETGDHSDKAIRIAADAKRAYSENTELARAVEAIQKQKEEAGSGGN
jgi:tetratricopeptide (TPR) repeat protein